MQVFVLAQSEMELVCPIELGKTELDGSSDDEGYNGPPHRGRPKYINIAYLTSSAWLSASQK